MKTLAKAHSIEKLYIFAYFWPTSVLRTLASGEKDLVIYRGTDPGRALSSHVKFIAAQILVELYRAM